MAGKERTHTNIDYLGVLDYLKKYGGKQPDQLDPAENEEYAESSQAAKEEMKKMADLCKKEFGLESEKIIFENKTTIRDYLWAQLKYSEYKENNNPICISIYADKSKFYRFGLDIRVNDKQMKQMESYYSYLDIPLQPGSSLVYMAEKKYGKYSTQSIINETPDDIKTKIQEGKYKTVRLCRICKIEDWIEDRTADVTDTDIKQEINDDIERAMLDAVEELIPYYKLAIGEDEHKSSDEKDVSQEMQNPNGFDKNIILYGPPGTGKTYNSVIYAVAICDRKKVDIVEKKDYAKVIMARYEELKKAGRIAFTTFHQSYGYEEFIEGIKPVVDEEAKDVSYTIAPGVFKKFCDDASKNNKEPYVFIIDEINRGNISKIFGELITLIESTKREGMDEAASAILPYSGKMFSVPSNVYILGTMNTADRSIALMDTALRRRFQFIEKMPDYKVLERIGADKVKVKVEDKEEELNVVKMLRAINHRITFLYDREHTIGHAFFTGLKGLEDDQAIEKLKSIFQNSVIPLLQEYFCEDYQKIQLVLGDDDAKINDSLKFIVDKEVVAENIFNGNVKNVMDLPEKEYSINEKIKDVLGNIYSYKKIYEKIDEKIL